MDMLYIYIYGPFWFGSVLYSQFFSGGKLLDDTGVNNINENISGVFLYGFFMKLRNEPRRQGWR